MGSVIQKANPPAVSGDAHSERLVRALKVVGGVDLGGDGRSVLGDRQRDRADVGLLPIEHCSALVGRLDVDRTSLPPTRTGSTRSNSGFPRSNATSSTVTCSPRSPTSRENSCATYA